MKRVILLLVFISAVCLARQEIYLLHRGGFKTTEEGGGSGGGGTGGYVGPLDLYSNNVVGAWSMSRKLTTNYSGSAFRIYRKSDGAETNIGFLTATNVDIAGITNWAGNTNALICKLYDQGGTNDLFMTSAVFMPCVYDGTNVFSLTSGKTAMRNKWAAAAGATCVTNNTVPEVSTFACVFLAANVYGWEGGSSAARGFQSCASDDEAAMTANVINTNQFSIASGNTVYVATNNAFNVDIVWAVQFGTNNGTTASWFNTQIMTNLNAGSTLGSGWNLGGINVSVQRSLFSHISESIVFHERMSDANRDIIRSNMNWFYQAY